MVKHTLKVLRCIHRKTFKLCLTILKHYEIKKHLPHLFKILKKLLGTLTPYYITSLSHINCRGIKEETFLCLHALTTLNVQVKEIAHRSQIINTPVISFPFSPSINLRVFNFELSAIFF